MIGKQVKKQPRSSSMVTHAVRTKDGGIKGIKYGRKKAIYLYCMECLGWEGDPAECNAKTCPLWPFRGRTMASQRSK